MKHCRKTLILTMLIVFSICLAPLLSAKEIKKININEASVVELTQLKRIGPKIAQRIVEYRENYGPFELPEDIMKVKGIGPKTFKLNKDRIIVE
ncbi:MAG: helix-hairpin-helix domain-containing protein [Deltaproteobacteria bacterium]|nr:MAG: helix-hairpin-helix domain-containing protein [Deltaproteobacteria bacterium]